MKLRNVWPNASSGYNQARLDSWMTERVFWLLIVGLTPAVWAFLITTVGKPEETSPLLLAAVALATSLMLMAASYSDRDKTRANLLIFPVGLVFVIAALACLAALGDHRFPSGWRNNKHHETAAVIAGKRHGLGRSHRGGHTGAVTPNKKKAFGGVLPPNGLRNWGRLNADKAILRPVAS